MELPATSQWEGIEELLDATQRELHLAQQRYRETEERASELASELYQELIRTQQDADVALAENGRLLEGLRVMTEALNVQQTWEGVVTVLQPILGFEHAFALIAWQEETLQVVVWTDELFTTAVWQVDQVFSQVLAGQTVVSPEVAYIPEWQQPMLRKIVGSALHVPLRIGAKQAILIYTHSQPGFFGKKHVILAERFASLAAQALRNAELYASLKVERDTLEMRVRQRTIELTTQRDFALKVMNTMGQGLVVTDMNGRFEFVNYSFANMLGCSAQALIGKTLLELVIPEDRLLLEAATTRWFSGQSTTCETGLRIADNQTVYVLISGSPHQREDYSMGSIAVITDLTERLNTQKELEKAKIEAENAARVKADFLANMSHEIRTPLNAVIGLTGLLLDTDLTEQQQDYIETVRRSGNALLVIINDILDFSKIEAGKIEFEKQPIALAQCLQDATSLLAQDAREKHLQLTYEIAEGVPPFVEGDATRLLQVLINLVNNAIKFTRRGHVLVKIESLSCIDTVHELHFRVEDTGLGIPPERLSRLFQPFSQADASTTRKFGGTGLGLAICKRLIEMMGGRIWVESEVAKGSAFHFTIKAATMEKPPSRLVEQKVAIDAQMGHRHPLRILLAEDNAINQKVAKQMLRRIGYRADTASDGKEAIEKAVNQPYDVILMDIQMPEIDGLEATRQIKELLPLQQHPRIVALTANAMERQRKLYLEAGMDAYISKPFKIEELVDVLAHSEPLQLVVTAKKAVESLHEVLPPIDTHGFEEIMGEDTLDLLSELLIMFVEETPSSMRRLQQAVIGQDADTVHQMAHRLRGSGSSVSAVPFSELCYELELMGEQGELHGAQHIMRQIESEYTRIQDWVYATKLV